MSVVMEWLLKQAHYLPTGIIPLAIWVIGIVLAIVMAFGHELLNNATPLQRRFWAFVFLLFATFVAAGAQAISRLDDLSQSYDRLAGLVPLALEYEKLHVNSRDNIVRWSTSSLNLQIQELRAGWIDLRTDQAQQEIAKLYYQAIDQAADKPFIVAVNVGSTNFYFGNTQQAVEYRQANQAAFRSGVPIIRYYLFDHHHPILLSDGKKIAQTFDDFANDTRRVATDTDAVFSAALDISNWSKSSTARDFLWAGLVEAPVIAETHLDDGWLPDYARATEDPIQLGTGQVYLGDLAALVNDDCVEAGKGPLTPLEPNGKICVVMAMTDAKLNGRDTKLSDTMVIAKYEKDPGAKQKGSAWCLYEDVLDLAQIPYPHVCHLQ